MMDKGKQISIAVGTTFYDDKVVLIIEGQQYHLSPTETDLLVSRLLEAKASIRRAANSTPG